MRHYSTNFLTNINCKKWIVYQAQTFNIWSLFILIPFKLDQIVCDILNIAVTKTKTSYPNKEVNCTDLSPSVSVPCPQSSSIFTQNSGLPTRKFPEFFKLLNFMKTNCCKKRICHSFSDFFKILKMSNSAFDLLAVDKK